MKSSNKTQPLGAMAKRLTLLLAMTVAVASIAVANAQATYPGGNGSLYFDADVNPNDSAENFAIQSVAVDGTGQTTVYDYSAAPDAGARFSADGSKFIFYSGGSSSPGIYTVDPNGGSETLILESAGMQDRSPMLSPDGSKIVFVSERDGNAEIYKMNSDGTDLVNLTNNAATDLQPQFTPDGSKVIFTSTRADSSAIDIYSMDTDGGNVVRLTEADGFSDATPSISPNGAKIAYETDRNGNQDIYTMDIDGGYKTRLTSDSGDDKSATYSPDGTKIAFFSTRDDGTTKQIYTMGTDGSNQTKLTSIDHGSAGVDDLRALDWQPVANTDLAVSAVANTGPFYFTSDLTYSVTFTNSAASMQGVTAALSLSGASLSSVSIDSGTCTVLDTATATCDLGTLAAGATVNATVTATNTAPGTATLTATSAGWGPDSDSSNNSSTADLTISSDLTKPTSKYVLKDCGSRSSSSCKKLRAKRSTYKKLYGKVSDAETGIAGAEFALYSKIKGSSKCYGLAGSSTIKVKKMDCTKAKAAFKDGKAYSASSRFTHYLKISNTPPQSNKNWYMYVRSTDNSGNISSRSKKKLGKLT